MLSKFSNSRSLRDNVQLGVLTAFCAGMVNVASLIIFFAFTSNATGHYAILAEEIVRGHWHQVGVVAIWIFLFFFGSFSSNFIVINLNSRNTYFAHALPLLIEMACLLAVGYYGVHHYQETLRETEVMIALMLYAMGIQNGLTATISNFAVKTTHLTGTTTDLGVLYSMFTKAEYRSNEELRGKAFLLTSIAISYISGGIASAFVYQEIGFKVFYLVCVFISFVIVYDYSKIRLMKAIGRNRRP
jgi:uncharacterized membrane protein YoaK (UPF0700 family)